MIWLLGENKGKEACNNVFYFWKNAIKRRDEGYDAYYVAEKNAINEVIYEQLQEWEQEFFIWKETKQHISLYEKSYFNVIQNDLEDVVPSKLYSDESFENPKRIIVLDDGIYHIENQKYTQADSFNGLLTKIYTYNTSGLSNNPDIFSYQLKNNRYLYPRLEALGEMKECNNDILWYLTAKSYDEEINYEYRKLLVRLISDHDFAKYLIDNNRKLKIILGREFEFEFKVLQKYESVMSVMNEEDCNLNELIVESGELITDYSPIVWDFALAGKKVHLFAPDLHLQEDYTKSVYSELQIIPLTNIVDLLNDIKEGISVHEKFSDILSVEDTKDILAGKSSDFIIDDLLNMLSKRNTFIMYNFSGVSELNKYVNGLGKEILKDNGLFDVITIVERQKGIKQVSGSLVIEATNYRNSLISKYQKKLKTQYKKGAKLSTSLQYEPDPLGVYTSDLEVNLCDMVRNISSGTVVSTKEIYHHLVHDNVKDEVSIKYLYSTNINLLKRYSNEFLNKLRLDFNFLTPAIFLSDHAKNQFIEYFKLETQQNITTIKYMYEPSSVKQVLNHKRAGKQNILINIIFRKENNLNELFNLMEGANSEQYHFILFGYGPELEYFLMKLAKANINNYYYEGVLRKREVAYTNCDFVISICQSEAYMFSIIDAYKCNRAVLKLETKNSNQLCEEIGLATFINIPDLLNTLNDTSKLEKFFAENRQVVDNVNSKYDNKENYALYE